MSVRKTMFACLWHSNGQLQRLSTIARTMLMVIQQKSMLLGY